jgi:hypothetical protein
MGAGPGNIPDHLERRVVFCLVITMIKSHSLHKSNIVFVFKEHVVSPPENHEIVGLYTGAAAKGAQLVDDPMMRMKILDVPARGLQVAWEARRVRVEDMRAVEPDASTLAEDAVMVYETLCSPRKISLDSFGFNFEVYYQTADVIRINDHYNEIAGIFLDLGAGLMDFGWQWTVAEKNGKELNGYFLKVTAPLEFTMHHNTHIAARELPSKKDLQVMFENAYEATNRTAAMLKL